ncbi:MAG: tetratricopeptide repeat protein [Sandaracinaceae bacterium]|nr:tetratricopeptide repeat protein [Sandaracinaceae bacterium]
MLERLRQGLTPANLTSFFAPGDGVALRCAELFGVPIAACDALTAAASRQRSDLPYLGPDDGAALSAELASAGVSPADSREVVRALTEMLLSVPGSLDSSERGRGIAELLRACPGGLVDRDAQVRAWHLGATSDLARCIGRTAGRAGRRAPQMIERVVGMNAQAGVVFLRWTHGQPVAPPAPRGPTRDEVLAQATAHYRAGRFSEAAQAYQQAVTLDPGFAPAHQGLAVSRMRAGDARGAADAYRAAARLDPRSAAIQVGLARALAQAGDREGAALAYRMALTLEPGRADAQRELAALAPPAPAPPPQPAGPSEADLRAQARAHYAAQRFAPAEQAYRRLTELAPNDAGGYAGLGASLLALGRANEAAVAYRRAVELDGRNAGFFVALGASYERSGNAAGARAAYERALTLDASQRQAREGLARVAPRRRLHRRAARARPGSRSRRRSRRRRALRRPRRRRAGPRCPRAPRATTSCGPSGRSRRGSRRARRAWTRPSPSACASAAPTAA